MKKRIFAYCLFTFGLALIGERLQAQNIPVSAPAESLQVCTDRDLYISGEPVQFSALLRNPGGTETYQGSRVLYCEVISPDGNVATSGKFSIEDKNSQGCLYLPVETLSGYYYFRAYTRVMRNYGPENYRYILLKIINPDREEVIKNPETTGIDSIFKFHPLPEPDTLAVWISTDKTVYQPGEEIRMRIEGVPGSPDSLKFCLAMVPEASRKETVISAQETSFPEVPPMFYADTRGISLSGKVTDQNTGQPVVSTIINLSVVGERDMMATRTDSSGRFLFTLPSLSGSHDIFLCAEDRPGIQPEMFIDNDFCTQPVRLPSPEFSLSPEETESALKIARNQKIATIYYPGGRDENTDRTQDTLPFYGKPDEILVMEKYIDLPTMEDYFQELVGAVNVRNFEGRKVFRFNSARAEMTIYTPLVLIDWVAVDDIDRVLAMAPADIDRIELVNAPYIKGNIIYGGIISFVSKKYDYAGVDLPKSGTFVNYTFFNDCRTGPLPSPLPLNMPDARNTVYWEPDLIPDKEGKAEIIIKVPDTPGGYVIVLSRLSSEGISVITKRLEIRDRK